MPKLPSHPVIYEINTIAWLSELSRRAGAPVTLGTVPAHEWDAIARLGVHAVWLMGVWERSPAGLAIAAADTGHQEEWHRILPDLTSADVAGSPYCVRRYSADASFGGRDGLALAREQLEERGVGLVLDYVPNHVAPDHPWVEEHPERFIQGTEADLAADPASFFRAGSSIIACGRDPYFPAWSDVAQVNAFASGLRAATVETLSDIATQCDGVRCDMAMLLMNDIFARTWGDRAGGPPIEDFWDVVIGRVRARFPEFTFIAEAYWDREWALQQQGFDYCYDKRLYDRLEHEAAPSVRTHLKADRTYQDRLMRFIENHDEPRAAAAFGVNRSRAAAVLIAALPGAKLLHQGQFEGRTIRLPVFLTRWPRETPNESLRAFYESLLHEAAHPVFRSGQWWLLACSGWPDNDRWQDLIACAWQDAQERRAIVVNLSGVRSQARVWLPWDSAAARGWRLTDALHGVVFDREGGDLASNGLYVDLAPWAFHWLRVEPHEP
jgi:hypothetical protein